MSGPYLLRDMRSDEVPELWRLFHDTIHSVNARDYDAEQRAAWSPAEPDMKSWQARMADVAPFVAVADGQIVGFSDLQADGLVDFMFVHHQWQGKGVAGFLMDEVDRRAAAMGLTRMYSHVSHTAKGFFERRGWRAVRENHFEMNGVAMSNWDMEKALT